MRKNPSRVIFASILFLVIVTSQSGAGRHFNDPINTYVWDAGYADMNGSGPLDIYWNTTTVATDLINQTDFQKVKGVLIAALEYPSGLMIWYTVFLQFYHVTTNLTFYFYDHATESGWYVAHIFSMSEETYKDNQNDDDFWEAIEIVGALDLGYDDDNYNDNIGLGDDLEDVYYTRFGFDPPGGIGGTPPRLVIMSNDDDTHTRVTSG